MLKGMQQRERYVEIFVCSVPNQVEEIKENEVSHELNSQEIWTEVVKWIDHKGKFSFCSRGFQIQIETGIW